MNQFYLLPCSKDVCQSCGIKHLETEPHDATSFRYRFIYANNHPQGKTPTWEDAMAHCEEEVKERWRYYLRGIGIDTNSKDVFGGIKSEFELQTRLDKIN